MTSISLCMIVFNEELNIERCLKSAYKFVDEIIIVDTGSTDKTKSICKNFGAKVFDYKWDDDFASARNFGLSKAKCDWILLLDADEELIVYDFKSFKKHLQSVSNNVIPVRMVHFYEDNNYDEAYSYISSGLRVLRNKKNLSFRGKIHESLVLEKIDIYENVKPNSFVQISHFGYTKRNLETKAGRNINMLLKEIETNPDGPWLYYHLGAEYYRLNNFLEAYKLVNMSILKFLDQKIIPPAIAYKLKYDMLISTKNFETAYHGILKAIELYPDYVDLHFYKGIIQYNYKEYENAIETFSHCIMLGENNPKYLILSGVGSFFSLYYLSICYEK